MLAQASEAEDFINDLLHPAMTDCMVRRLRKAACARACAPPRR
jgi:hypothetical protein